MCELKKCSSCGYNKPLSEFGKDKYKKDGFSYRCKQCTINKIPSLKLIPKLGELKICEICKKEKDVSLFPKRTDRDYKYEKRCWDCKKENLKINDKLFKGNQKLCSICSEYKNPEDFIKASSPIGLSGGCKICSTIRRKVYTERVPKEIRNQYKRDEYERNKQTYFNYIKNRLATDILYKLKSNIRSQLGRSFNKGERSVSSSKILGCTILEFKNHIESQFLPWMSWDNYGNCEGNTENCSWVLDHIIPIKSAKTKEDVYLLNHWSNFQPLCGILNRSKSSTVYPCTNLELSITFWEDIYELVKSFKES